jgi:hypothetical protein
MLGGVDEVDSMFGFHTASTRSNKLMFTLPAARIHFPLLSSAKAFSSYDYGRMFPLM